MKCLDKLFQVLMKFISKTFPLTSLYIVHNSRESTNKHIVTSINKSYQGSFPKVIVLKCSTRVAISNAFRKATCTKTSISKNSAEMPCLRKFFQVLAKSLNKTFPK